MHPGYSQFYPGMMHPYMGPGEEYHYQMYASSESRTHENQSEAAGNNEDDGSENRTRKQKDSKHKQEESEEINDRETPNRF